MAAGVHAYVDAHRNCEDIAMAFLVANLTAAPPEYVRAPALRDLGQGLFKASPRRPVPPYSAAVRCGGLLPCSVPGQSLGLVHALQWR